jgi:glycosyltransferase involved in cell wall biosynthesis
MSMRVIVSRMAALGQKTGIGHYTTQLLRCLHEQTLPDEIEEYPGGWLLRLRQAFAPKRVAPPGKAARPGLLRRMRSALRVPTPALHLLRRVGRHLTARHFRLATGRDRFDLYHEPNFIPFPTDLPTVATLHDLSVVLHPEWHPADRVRHFEQNFRRGLTQCRHYFAISEAGRQEIIRELGIPADRVTRTYMGIRPGLGRLPQEEVAATLKRLGLPARYLLCLGTVEPRKNVLTLLRAYGRLPSPLREKWPLLLVGGWGWNTADVADYYHAEARHRGVVHLGYVADEHIPALYNGARALACPTLYEGFGLPPIEMMACGGAVLASTAPSLVETVGRKAHLTDAMDEDGWRAALERVVTDDDWRRSLRSGAEEVARPYTWDACAADTLGVYRAICGGGTVPLPERRRAAG